MRLLIAVLALLFASPVMAAEVDTGHLKIEMVAQDASVAPGSTAYVALRQQIDAGWHTYWRNPGDSGEATKLTWTLPAGWKAGDIVWATPRTLPFGPLTNYGYSDAVVLPVPIEVPASAKPGPVTLEAVVDVLVCEKICIPETGKVSVTLTVAEGTPSPDARWGATVAAALAAAPKPAGLIATFQNAGALTLTVAGAPLKGADMTGAWFFPFLPTVIDHAKPQTAERGTDGLTLTLAPGYAFEAGKPPAAMDGVLVVGGKAYEIAATPGPAPAGVAGLGPPPSAAGPVGAVPKSGLLIAALTAFLGGLILNLMPCVFPVLSMKAASLAGHAHETRAARRQGLAYGAGVVVTFLVLAGVLIALQLAGQQVGWGFQLQSPPVVGVLALLMLAVALNMSGVFEIGTSLQGAGSGLAARGGLAGAFFTGVLAVVVASPCTAPFMAGALGFTLGQPPVIVLAVFLALSLGFAAPFVALAFAPALLRRLPKPGAWMDTLRKVLAFPMYGAAAWLVWVLSQQTDAPGLALALFALLLAAFGLWLWGLGPKLWRQGLALLLLLAAISLALQPQSAAQPAASETASAADLPSEAWSAERVAALRGEGKVVFVNFTAAWCVSCQVNDKVALSTEEVAKAMTATGAVYLKADWTNRNPEIAAALAEHGRAGVPLYLVYGPGLDEPQVLPQLLTPGMVADALRKAGKTGS
ncbi:MAG: protein-disulfide reductase DsbD family protein [Caulobacter sp.]|nr:protein-disulfide reductase DsbD family protein [Caulobacter sp.]